MPILAHAGLLLTWDLAAHLGLTVFWLLLAFGGVVLGSYRIARMKRGRGVLILAVAILVRALLLPLPPTLSDDIERYLWDGKVVSAGFNPYILEPDATELGELRDEEWKRLPHRQIPTVYPPLALAVFGAANSLPAPIVALKVLLTLCDLVSCLLLLMLVRTLRLPVDRLVWYAWNPLVTLEVAGMGHVDSLGVACMVLMAVCLSRRPRWAGGAALAAAGGVLAKLVPVVGLPVWARHSGRPFVFLSIAFGLLLAVLVPVVLISGGVPPGLVAFGIDWEFNGPIYEPLWRIIDGLEVDSAVSSLLDGLKVRTGEHDFWNRFYPYNYPQLWAKLLLAVGFMAALGRAVLRKLPFFGLLWIFGSLILASATVYPWYLLWVTPWAALAGSRAWLVASGSVILSYIPQFTDVELFPWIYLAVWLPPLLVWMRHRWFSD